MKYISKKNVDSWEICDHPFERHIDPGVNRLILGTFPTYRNNYKETFDFYYAGESNRFWSVIDEVFNPGFIHTAGPEAKKEREGFFSTNGIGITDMLQKCWRKNKSSLDKDLYPIILTDVFNILSDHQSIQKIILTSRSGPMSALGLFKTLCIQKNRSLPDLKEDRFRILQGEFEFNGRIVKILVPHSTSRTNDKVSFSELTTMYKFCLKE